MKTQIEPIPSAETEIIRSQIDTTRHRMDETIDALGRRLKGRHLIDEALHLFRKQQENGNMTKITQKITQSADTAYHSVVDTIKAHPVPIALVGAGVGWLIYERSRANAANNCDSSADISQYRVRPYDELEFGSMAGQTAAGDILEDEDYGEGSGTSLKNKASQAVGSLQQKASQVRTRIADTSAQAKERTRELYQKSRERVSTTVEQHPLQSGLACLAVGLLAGLLLPTPRKLTQSLAPKARELSDRVRHTAEDLVERGTHVVQSATQAATQAAKNEAQTQGFTSGSASRESSSEKGVTAGSPTSVM